jgi:hypothetical protein
MKFSNLSSLSAMLSDKRLKRRRDGYPGGPEVNPLPHWIGAANGTGMD